jgi:organic radical activating enzyme
MSSIFKFVINPQTLKADFEEIKSLLSEVPIDPCRVYAMPLGTTVADQLLNMKLIADRVLAEGWNLTPRLHTLIWGDERAR